MCFKKQKVWGRCLKTAFFSYGVDKLQPAEQSFEHIELICMIWSQKVKKHPRFFFQLFTPNCERKIACQSETLLKCFFVFFLQSKFPLLFSRTYYPPPPKIQKSDFANIAVKWTKAPKIGTKLLLKVKKKTISLQLAR